MTHPANPSLPGTLEDWKALPTAARQAQLPDRLRDCVWAGDWRGVELLVEQAGWDSDEPLPLAPLAGLGPALALANQAQPAERSNREAIAANLLVQTPWEAHAWTDESLAAWIAHGPFFLGRDRAMRARAVRWLTQEASIEWLERLEQTEPSSRLREALSMDWIDAALAQGLLRHRLAAEEPASGGRGPRL